MSIVPLKDRIKCKTLIETDFGYIAIIDFPVKPTSFDQYPSGRLIVGDMFTGDVVYYRLHIFQQHRHRARQASDAVRKDVVARLKIYIHAAYGHDVAVHGWSQLNDYLSWLFNPVGSILGQTPGTKLVPVNRGDCFELYMELPQLIFFKMEPRVTLEDETGRRVTVMSHEYEEYKEFFGPETVRPNYKRDGFFGKMMFHNRLHFFAVQVANLSRWNRLERDANPNRKIDKTFSNSMHKDDLSAILHREIKRHFPFMVRGTVGRIEDIEVLFKMPSVIDEKLVGDPNAQEHY